jgi:hypothetical protein
MLPKDPTSDAKLTTAKRKEKENPCIIVPTNARK